MYAAIKYQATPVGKAWLESQASDVTAKIAGAAGGRAAGEVLAYSQGKQMPVWFAFVYGASNLTLALLNVYWFGQMIKTIRKRFEPPFGTKVPEKKNVVMGRGLRDDGIKSVQVSSVRHRSGKGKVESSESEEEVPPN